MTKDELDKFDNHCRELATKYPGFTVVAHRIIPENELTYTNNLNIEDLKNLGKKIFDIIENILVEN